MRAQCHAVRERNNRFKTYINKIKFIVFLRRNIHDRHTFVHGQR